MTRYLAIATVLVTVLHARLVWPQCSCNEPECFAQTARALIEGGKAERAVALLKEALKDCPELGSLKVLLGVAYLRANNPVWAVRTMQARVAEAPEDCEARAWLAWGFLELAALDQAWEAASDKQCEEWEGGRLALIRAMVARARGDLSGAVDEVFEARSRESLWESDRAALRSGLRAALHLPYEFSWRLEGAAGFTSNALLGSPTDPSSGTVKQGRSEFFFVDAFARFSPWVHKWFWPVAEFEVKRTIFLAQEVRGLSWLDITGRLGLSGGKAYPRLYFGWRPDWLLLAQGDRYDNGPVWYYGGNRGEFELEIAPWLLIFGGAGWRSFREMARSRFESDLGIGGSVGLFAGTSLLWAASGRIYRARHEAWHLFGGSGILQVQAALRGRLSMKAGLTAALDAYPRSAGYVRWGALERKRRDILLKPIVSLWSPAWHGLKIGLQYEFSWRNSSLPQFGFEDHRVSVRLVWAGDAEIFGPKKAASSPLADLPWALSGEDQALDRVQDLLRQDESVQRSSSCVQ